MVNVDEAAGRLKMSVSDTGVGIPKEKRGELFKRFMQSNFSGDSVGVGLHLTHELVNVHKGTITYEENPGGGSIFIVTLPTDKSVYEEKDFLVPNNVLLREEEMAEKHLADVVLKDEEGLEEVLPVNPLNKYKVLIVEDETRLAETLRQLMRELRYQADVVHTGKDGLDYGLAGQYDLILLDVMLPELDGFQVARQLRAARDPGVAVIALGDKLSNLRALYRSKERQGAAMWDCFHQRDPEAHHWYYRTIAEVLSPLAASAAWREYDWLLRQVFDEASAAGAEGAE